jgi:hypothetical protein
VSKSTVFHARNAEQANAHRMLSRIMARNPKLRDLSRLPPEYNDVSALIKAFGFGEHPIATAILGAVLIEHKLERLLRSKLKHKDDKTWAMLIADDGPLNRLFLLVVILGLNLFLLHHRLIANEVRRL